MSCTYVKEAKFAFRLHDYFSGGEPWGSKSWKSQNYSEPDRELVCPPWAGIPKTILTFFFVEFSLPWRLLGGVSAALERRFDGSWAAHERLLGASQGKPILPAKSALKGTFGFKTDFRKINPECLQTTVFKNLELPCKPSS